MTVKELKQAIASMDDDLEVVIMECKKHEDNAPLMTIEDVEQVTTDDNDDEVCMISMQPNPQTILESKIKEAILSWENWRKQQSPTRFCTVHPPAGSGGGIGLYELPLEDVVDKFLTKLLTTPTN